LLDFDRAARLYYPVLNIYPFDPNMGEITMRRKMSMVVLISLSLLLWVTICTGQTQGGSVTGRVSFAREDGKITYGDWVRVFLTTQPIDVPAVDLASIDIPLERQSRINSAHMEFYINFRQMQDKPGYVVSDKLTRPEGTFAFYRIPAGQYYIVITFPTMIAGSKCAWQAAVVVEEGQTVRVELNNDNLAIPAF